MEGERPWLSNLVITSPCLDHISAEGASSAFCNTGGKVVLEHGKGDEEEGLAQNPRAPEQSQQALWEPRRTPPGWYLNVLQSDGKQLLVQGGKTCFNLCHESLAWACLQNEKHKACDCLCLGRALKWPLHGQRLKSQAPLGL